MSQTTLTSFFNSRKRPASDDIVSSKNKILHIEHASEVQKNNKRTSALKNSEVKTKHIVPESELKLSVPQDESFARSTQQSSQELQIQRSTFTKKTNTVNIGKNKESSETQCARKDLSLGDLRKRLAGSSRLAEIKASAERLSKGIQQLKEATESRNLKEFKTIDLEVPKSPSKRLLVQNELLSPKKDNLIGNDRPLISPRKVVVSPIKSPSKVPAYIRHASLATTTTSLPLPHHYRFLAELFRGMEAVVALLYNRNEKISFKKLKPSVQEMLKRNFTEKHLAQIKHLVPDFYNFEVQKVKNFCTSTHKETFELTISPNFPNDIKVMNPTMMLERRRYFYDTLLKQVKKHHSQYLSSLDPPMIIPDDKLVRWHPGFEIEKIPEVESAKLPEMPNVEKFSTAQDVLAKARELFKCNTKMERALEKLAQAKARGLTDQEKKITGIVDKPANGSQTNQPSTSGVNILNPALRNLPASLLEKVKAKQAAKALEAMTRTTENEQKYIIYSRLPDLARTLRNIYVTERKNVLALNIVLSKLDSSFKANVSQSDLQRDINVLTQEVPEWVVLHNIRNTAYLKLDKAYDLKIIITKLENLVEKYKND